MPSANARSSSGKRQRRQLFGAQLHEEIAHRVVAHAGTFVPAASIGKPERFAAVVVGLRDGTRQRAHAQDVALAFGDRDRLARVQQVEGVRGLHHLLVRRQREFRLEQLAAGGFVFVEVAQQHRGVGMLEVVSRLLHFVLVEHVAVGDAAERPIGPHDVEDAFDALQIHREALEAVGDFTRDGFAVEAADLLEVRELRDFHAVQPDFPAETPGAERRRLPVVLDEAHVVHARVEAERAQRSEVQIEDRRAARV